MKMRRKLIADFLYSLHTCLNINVPVHLQSSLLTLRNFSFPFNFPFTEPLQSSADYESRNGKTVNRKIPAKNESK